MAGPIEQAEADPSGHPLPVLEEVDDGHLVDEPHAQPPGVPMHGTHHVQIDRSLAPGQIGLEPLADEGPVVVSADLRPPRAEAFESTQGATGEVREERLILQVHAHPAYVESHEVVQAVLGIEIHEGAGALVRLPRPAADVLLDHHHLGVGFPLLDGDRGRVSADAATDDEHIGPDCGVTDIRQSHGSDLSADRYSKPPSITGG